MKYYEDNRDVLSLSRRRQTRWSGKNRYPSSRPGNMAWGLVTSIGRNSSGICPIVRQKNKVERRLETVRRKCTDRAGNVTRKKKWHREAVCVSRTDAPYENGWWRNIPCMWSSVTEPWSLGPNGLRWSVATSLLQVPCVYSKEWYTVLARKMATE